MPGAKRPWTGPRGPWIPAAAPAPVGPAGGTRTDLAIESVRGKAGEATLPAARGVRVEEDRDGSVAISRVHVDNEEGERIVGKPVGTYVTLDAPDLRRRNTEVSEQVARVLAHELERLLDLGPETKAFVVGLGNWNATPDALGPKVISELLVTRHLSGQVPADLVGDVRSVAAIAPGVLGLTGIETGDIIAGIVERIRPDVVIAVDALASRSIERVVRTIQLADTGIHPGSGVGNHRAGINRETIGVPVVALGVPTVVHAATIAADTIDLLAEREGAGAFAGAEGRPSPEERRRLIAEVLAPAIGDMMVTPKEIDLLIDDMARIIAAGINAALHPKVAAQKLLLS